MTRRSFLSHAAGSATLTTGLARAAQTAPEFTGLGPWLNVSAPLTMAGLRGKVVLVEFGTYTCINWRRTLPYVKRWYAEYAPRGLEIVTIHTPEFSFERAPAYVRDQIEKLGVRNPVAQDNGFLTWQAFGNQVWPSFYLFDTAGQLRLVREGEGNSRDIEAGIRTLLGLSAAGPGPQGSEDADLSRIGTPEMYFGASHPTPQSRAQSPRTGDATFSFTRSGPGLNTYELDGQWARADEPLTLRSSPGRIRIRFSAAKLHLIAGAPQPSVVRVTTDGGPPRIAEIGIPTMYTLVDSDAYGEHLAELEFPSAGPSLFSATFG